MDPRYKTDFLAVETNNNENALTQLDKVTEELLKNAVFLATPVQDQENDVLPVPVPKKVKLSLGALTSLKKPETMLGLNDVRRYLAIPATSSPSERLFSKAGQVSTPARAQLKPEKVDQLVFLAENL